MDDIRPRGTVQLECPECKWSAWYDALHPDVEAAKQPGWKCRECRGEPAPTMKG